MVTGANRFETRRCSTKYRGPLLIHAAKGFRVGARRFSIEALGKAPEEFVCGAIIGRVILKNVYRAEELASTLTALERLYGDYTPGRWAWELTEAEMFEPIPWKGALGLFEVILPAGVGI